MTRGVGPLLGSALLAVACGADGVLGPAELAGGTWNLVRIVTGDSTITVDPGDPQPTMVFRPDAADPQQGEVGGFGGCNDWGGRYVLVDTGIGIDNIVSTLRACAPGTEIETVYFNLLSEVRLQRGGNGRLTLETLDGQRLEFEVAQRRADRARRAAAAPGVQAL